MPKLKSKIQKFEAICCIVVSCKLFQSLSWFAFSFNKMLFNFLNSSMVLFPISFNVPKESFKKLELFSENTESFVPLGIALKEENFALTLKIKEKTKIIAAAAAIAERILLFSFSGFCLRF